MRKKNEIIYFSILAILLTQFCGIAATKTISSGSWLVAGNWSPAGLPVDGDDIFITGAVNLPFQDNDISLNNVTITVTSTGYFTVNKKCDVIAGFNVSTNSADSTNNEDILDRKCWHLVERCR